MIQKTGFSTFLVNIKTPTHYLTSFLFVSGLSFSLLAGLPPIYGLYTSFWAVLVYFLLGQSQHLSIGSMAIMSIMSYDATSREVTTITMNPSNSHSVDMRDLDSHPDSGLINITTESTTMTNNNLEYSEEDIQHRVYETMSVTFLIGLLQLAMYICRLSNVVAFIPVSCISGFTTGCAFHIATSQMKPLLGISYPGHKGVFKLIKTWREIFLVIPETNLCDLTISVLCITFLITIKEIVNPKFRHKLPIPIPAELIIVVIVTLVSYFAKLNQHFGIKIIENIPQGLPAPEIPPMDDMENYFVDSLLMAIVSFVISYSMVSTLASKHHYDINPNQEMLASGMIHTVGALFGGFATAAAPPRCTILSTTGAKTLLVHVFSLLVIILTVFLVGPLLEPLPNSCLGCIIICAILPLFKQFQQLPQFWKVNKWDFAIWMVTWLSVVILDITLGLAIGVGFSILTPVIQSCQSKGSEMAILGHIDLQVPSGHYESGTEIPGIKIFRFDSDLHFASQARFKQQLFKHTMDPKKLTDEVDKGEELPCHLKGKSVNTIVLTDIIGAAKHEISLENGVTDIYTITDHHPETKSIDPESPNTKLHTIIIDCASIAYIDIMGLNTIKQLSMDYNYVGVNIVLASCSASLLRKLAATGHSMEEAKIQIYPTVQDAIIGAHHSLEGVEVGNKLKRKTHASIKECIVFNGNEIFPETSGGKY